MEETPAYPRARCVGTGPVAPPDPEGPSAVLLLFGEAIPPGEVLVARKGRRHAAGCGIPSKAS
jgi:hypothetical protein